MANMSFANNAATTLASGINSSVTSLTVASGQGAIFPALSGSQYFYCTLENTAGTIREIVKVTAVSTDTFTIVRAQDGTSAQSFSTGDKVELRLVRANLNDFPKLDEVNTFSQAQTLSAAPILSSITGLVKGNGASAVTAATAGTDYVAPGGALGTPSSGTLTSCTGLPVSTGISGLGTGVATALAVNIGSAGAPVTNGGALGTPSSGTLTNCTFPTLNQNTTGSAGSVANALTIGTGLTLSSGTTYNGSAAVTLNATGSTLNSQTSAYVPVAGDAGKMISITTGGVTINNSVFSAGNIITIYNNSASSQTITQGTGVTLQWAGQSSSTTGNRTLGLYGIATIVFLSASSAVISGAGLS
jgi:hypothetical protein